MNELCYGSILMINAVVMNKIYAQSLSRRRKWLTCTLKSSDGYKTLHIAPARGVSS